MTRASFVSICIALYAVCGNAGTIGMARAAVADVTPVEARTRYMALLEACRYVGYALTPTIGWALGYVHTTLFGFRCDGITAPGLMLAAMEITVLIMSRVVSVKDGHYFGRAHRQCRRRRRQSSSCLWWCFCCCKSTSGGLLRSGGGDVTKSFMRENTSLLDLTGVLEDRT